MYRTILVTKRDMGVCVNIRVEGEADFTVLVKKCDPLRVYDGTNCTVLVDDLKLLCGTRAGFGRQPVKM
jgi:hypothetical protein